MDPEEVKRRALIVAVHKSDAGQFIFTDEEYAIALASLGGAVEIVVEPLEAGASIVGYGLTLSRVRGDA